MLSRPHPNKHRHALARQDSDGIAHQRRHRWERVEVVPQASVRLLCCVAVPPPFCSFTNDFLIRNANRYYRLFAVAYRVCLRLVDVRMANSTWTRDHIVNLLGGAPSAAEIVYPPCDTTALGKIPIADEGKRERIIISLAQFRCERVDSFLSRRGSPS